MAILIAIGNWTNPTIPLRLRLLVVRLGRRTTLGKVVLLLRHLFIAMETYNVVAGWPLGERSPPYTNRLGHATKIDCFLFSFLF